MTEGDWLSCNDLREMLEFLGERVSDRKLRLFAAACCRQAGPSRPDPRWEQAVEAAEGSADGHVGRADLERAQREVGYAAKDLARSSRFGRQAAPWAACVPDAALAASNSAGLVASYHPEYEREQIALLRCLCINFFRPQTRVDPTWLVWEDGVIGRLAAGIYAERCWQDLPVLADALEEAGCGTVTILEHLREPGPHARGCWVVDLILAKS